MCPGPKTSGIVLAGGRSRRMGREKAGLQMSGGTLLERAVRTLEPIVDEVVVVGTPGTAPCGVRVIADETPGLGPLGGLATGLKRTRGERVLLVACDLPFLDRALLLYLMSLAPGYDAVVARIDGRSQPLHAVYDRRVGPIVDRQIASGAYRMEELVARLHVRWVEDAEIAAIEGGHRSFFNVNTPADWRCARALDQ